MLAFWLVALLCLSLLAALASALHRLEAAQAPGRAGAEPLVRGPGGGGAEARLERVLAGLLDLHGALEAPQDKATRESLCEAALRRACEAAGVERGEAVLFEPGGELPRRLAARGAPPAHGEEPAVAVPLQAGAKTLGALRLYRGASGGPALDVVDRRFLTLLAREAGLGLQTLETLESQQTFYLEMLQMLARAADAKDALGEVGSARARQMARAVAERLGLGDPDARHVEYAAMLHRVGKIGVDQTLLNKPGKLTPKEYEEIKKYTTIGHRILSTNRSMDPIARIILYHQEWFNGKGYPEGLRGEAIPLGARIVAVINAWQAMLSDRPYRKALPRDAAVAELRKGAGSQFDPSVVEAFLASEA